MQKLSLSKHLFRARLAHMNVHSEGEKHPALVRYQAICPLMPAMSKIVEHAPAA
jgi:hypothetical protein